MQLTSSQTLLAPLTIGGVSIDTPLFLAPMAGQTNHAFRTLCRDMGGVGLVCSELLSSHAMQYAHNEWRTEELMDWTPDEQPIAVQLFGADPREMAEAAKVVADRGATIVDINMGCWVPKVVKKGGGAALLNDVCTATAVVEAVVKAVDVPVTVKVRAGMKAGGEITAVPFARAAEDCGAQAIAVHARFASQGFSGHADWDVIRQVKQAVRHIPVIGNGDIFAPSDARAMLEQTGCDGVMVGRGALGNPWIFAAIEHGIRTGEPYPQPTPRQRAEACLEQARRTIATTKMRERKALFELRGQLAKYAEHLPDVPGRDPKTIRAGLVRSESLAEIEAALEPLLSLA